MTQPQDTDERRVSRRAFVTTTVTTAAIASVPASVAAQSDSEDDRSIGEQITLLIAGIRGEAASGYERLLGDRSDAETNALETQSEFNDHSDEWVSYVNKHSSLSGNIQVVALEFVPEPDDDPDDTHTMYLVADHDGEVYTSAEIVEQTDREVDETVVLESIAAENADAEIAEAYDKFVKPGDAPADEHLAYLAGKYRFGTAHITTTILGDELEGVE